MMDELRQTGRTTRMIEDAVKYAKEGRAVYVIAANYNDVRRLESLLPNDLGIKVETSFSPGNFDWRRMTLTGAYPNCIVLVDHFAIESEFSHILEMLHRYDAK